MGNKQFKIQEKIRKKMSSLGDGQYQMIYNGEGQDTERDTVDVEDIGDLQDQTEPDRFE